MTYVFAQRIETMKYMLGRFSMLFADMYAKRPHLAQMDCLRCDDGFGNVIHKDLSGYKSAQDFLCE